MPSTLLCLLLASVLNLSFAYILQLEGGEIEGTTLTTRIGQEFFAFRNVPFAEPPIRDLRFKAPVAKQPWSGVLDCTAYGPICMQESDFGLIMSENCLVVNVFTKNLPPSGDLKPVIAFIHGGGFKFGSSVDAGPEYLMERDIVLVTISYRLGAFGFLALDIEDAVGNQGLKDQALALQWIQKNIANFGGDPSKVTIAGVSAGGFSVTSHMISSMSQGLFSNVIAMSGAFAWQKKLKTDNLAEAEILAGKLNCPTTTVAEMLLCLKEVSNGLFFEGINNILLGKCRRHRPPHDCSVLHMPIHELAASNRARLWSGEISDGRTERFVARWQLFQGQRDDGCHS